MLNLCTDTCPDTVEEFSGSSAAHGSDTCEIALLCAHITAKIKISRLLANLREYHFRSYTFSLGLLIHYLTEIFDSGSSVQIVYILRILATAVLIETDHLLHIGI